MWGTALVAAVLIGLLVPPAKYLTWLPAALAACLLITFGIQLARAQREGFVGRVMLSVGGAVLVLAAATGVLWGVAVRL